MPSQTSALVTLYGGTQDSQSSPSSASASLSDGGSSANASANASGQVRASSSSSGQPTITNATASAFFNSDYRIAGASGGVPSIQFNFQLSGSLNANSDDTPLGFGGASVAFSAVHLSYGLNSSSLISNSSASLSVLKGVPLFTQKGFESASAGVKTIVTPRLTVSGQAKVQVTSEDVVSLGLDVKLEGIPQEYDFPLLASTLANAVNRIGLPRLNIAPGVSAGISFDVQNIFKTTIPFQVTPTGGGRISYSLATTSSALKDGSGTANYSNTLVLESVTVPKGFNPTGLKIVFDSGFEQRIYSDVAGQVVSGGASEDQLVGSALDDRLNGGDGHDRLSGLASDDTLIGGSGNDNLSGGDGNDTLFGEAGDDWLVGNLGADTLTGDAGSDRFVFDSGRRFKSSLGVDQITDFQSGIDQIVLDRTTFSKIQRVSFQSVRNLSQAKRSRAFVVYVRKTGSLFYNQNQTERGFGAGGEFARLQGGLPLKAQDFAIIS
jgi:Ca2+-binding RTX toxin-like protein